LQSPYQGSPLVVTRGSRPVGYSRPRPVEPDGGNLAAPLRRGWWIILLCAVASTALAYWWISREVRLYRATALVQLRDQGAELAGGLVAGQPSSVGKVDPLQSEVLLLTGRELARQVVNREQVRLLDPALLAPSPLLRDVIVRAPAEESREINLTFADSGFRATSALTTKSARYGVPVDLDGVQFTVPAKPARVSLDLALLSEDVAVDWLLQLLTVRPRENTDVITVSAIAPDNQIAVRLVNALVDQRVANATTDAQSLAKRRREFIEAQLGEIDGSFVSAQMSLGQFRGREGVYQSENMAAAQQAGKTQIELRRGELEVDRRSVQALLIELTQSNSANADNAFRTLLANSSLSGNPVISQLATRLGQQEVSRDSLLVLGRPASNEDVRNLTALIASTRARLVDAVRNQISTIDAKLASLDQLRARSETEINRLSPTEAKEVRLGQEVATLRSTGDQLRQEYQRARIAEAVAVGRLAVIERATRAVLVPSNGLLKLALGLVMGLMCGAGVLLLREYFNTSLHRRVEVESVLNVPGLGVIPQLPRKARRRAKATRAELKNAKLGLTAPSGLVTLSHSNDPSAEAYRGLRTRILFAQAERPIRSMVVTSATTEEGKTTTAANLAAAFAQQGLRCLIIDCDLRRPQLHTVFATPLKPGVSDVLNRQTDLYAAVRNTAVTGLDLLTAGAATAHPAEIIGSGALKVLLETVRLQYDIVVVDSPPLLCATDAAMLASMVDGVVMVVRAGRTERGMALEALQQLHSIGASVVGAVLNDTDARAEKYEAYGYSYAYPPSGG
jgi:polysaccharide biosynthesis transport protein